MHQDARTSYLIAPRYAGCESTRLKVPLSCLRLLHMPSPLPRPSSLRSNSFQFRKSDFSVPHFVRADVLLAAAGGLPLSKTLQPDSTSMAAVVLLDIPLLLERVFVFLFTTNGGSHGYCQEKTCC